MINGSNTRGMILMIASMAAFALADTLVKVSSSFLVPAQIMFFLMGGGLILFALIAVVQGDNLRDPRAFAPLMLLRYGSEVVGMVGMVLALSYAPLSTVGAVTQAAPILVALGAVVFLGEKVSWRRWSAITVGFIGVLLVIKPGPNGLDLAVLWAVLALVALSGRDLLTRVIPPDIGSASLATYTMLAAVPFAIGWVALSGEPFIPEHANWAVITFMVLLGSLGYLLLIAGLRAGEISVVMPFRYARIIFLVFLGILVFDERPSTTTLLGAALIIASGIYTMWRERQIGRGET